MQSSRPPRDPDRDGKPDRTLTDVARAATEEPGVGGDPQRDAKLRYGRYELLSELGSGGMGVVYEAHDPELDRPVALKVIGKSQRKVGSVARDRLVREARAMAKLAHPNVIAIYDVGLVGDEAFVAMELVRGRTLKDWLRGSPSQSRILEVFAQAGRGLAAAHAAGLVHRDFKPANVILGDDGRVRVLDFGLARLADTATASADIDAAPTAPLGSLTRTGGIVGTPAYMSPEQCLGEPVDERSDQFSFCASLYEALYGAPPYAANSVAERAEKIAAGDLQSPTADPPIPARLRDVVLQGLSPAPEARHASMQPLLDALTSVPRGSRRRALILGAAIIMLLVSATAVTAVWQQPAGLNDATGTTADVAAPSPLRMQVADTASPLMAKLGEHARGDERARRLGIATEVVSWSSESAGGVVTEHYLLAKDRSALASYLEDVANVHSELTPESGHQLLLGRDGDRWRTYYVWSRVELDHSAIQQAVVSHAPLDQKPGAPQVPVVLLTLNALGTAQLAAATGQNVGRRMVTIVSGTVEWSAVIAAPILGGELHITVQRSDPETMLRDAEALARALTPRT